MGADARGGVRKHRIPCISMSVTDNQRKKRRKTLKKIVLLFLVGFAISCQDITVSSTGNERPVFSTVSDERVLLRYRFKIGQKVAFEVKSWTKQYGSFLEWLGTAMEIDFSIQGEYTVKEINRGRISLINNIMPEMAKKTSVRPLPILIVLSIRGKEIRDLRTCSIF